MLLLTDSFSYYILTFLLHAFKPLQLQLHDWPVKSAHPLHISTHHPLLGWLHHQSLEHCTIRDIVYYMYSSETRLKNYLVNRVKLSRRKLTSQIKEVFITNVILIRWCHHINNLALPLANIPEHVQKYVIQSHLKRTTELVVDVKVLKGWHLDNCQRTSIMFFTCIRLNWYHCTGILQAIVASPVYCYDNQYSWRDHFDIVSSLSLSKLNHNFHFFFFINNLSLLSLHWPSA